METQKNIREPKGNSSATSKSAGARKQPGAGPGAAEGAAQGAAQGDMQGGTQGATPGAGAHVGTQAATPGAGAQAGTQGATPGAGTQAGTQGATPGAGAQAGTQGEQDLLQKAKQTTGEIVSQVQQRAGSQLTQQKESAATDLSTVVNAVRQFGENLAGEANGPIARYAAQYGDKAAKNLERLTNYIRQQDPKQLLDDVQSFGRRQPAWLLGGMFILGFAGARLIKSSMDAASQHEFHSGSMTPNLPAPRPSSLTPNVR